MLKFCTLCSSSSGNSTYIGNNNGGILIDAGSNAKQLTIALNNIAVSPDTIKAIFLTHEHTDHISAVKVFASRYSIPVYGTEGTLAAAEKLGCFNGKFEVCVMPNEGKEICGMEIQKCKTSHDSAESCGYIIRRPSCETKISVVTDTGFIPQETFDAVKGSDLILLESNHDPNMLQYGSYPYFLKERICSEKGHLSNKDCAEAAWEFVKSGTSQIVLGHLSRENNTPTLALETTSNVLNEHGAVKGKDYNLHVAPVKGSEEMIII